MMDKLNLTKDEACALANHIEMTLIQSIRDDVDIDSMKWLRNMCRAYEKLCVYGDYHGATEDDLFEEKKP